MDLEKLSDTRWKDASAIEAAIKEKIPELLASDRAYQNARQNSDSDNIRIEGEEAIRRAISAILSDYIELFRQFTQNSEFRKRLTCFVLTLTNRKPSN